MRKLFFALLILPQLCLAQGPPTNSNPLGGNLTVQDAGTCLTMGSFLWQHLPSNAATTTVNLAGTFSGTLTIRLSNNGGGSWTTNSTTTSSGTTSISTNSFTDICADVTTFTSGSFAVTISTGLNTGPVGPQGPPGSGSSSPSSPLLYATSGPGPVFNMANYAGAFHDTKSNTFCDTSISTTQVTCSVINGVNPFCNGTTVACQAGQTSDVGKRIQCSDGVDGLDWATGSTITSVISSTVAAVSGARTFAGSGQKCTYGHPDDAALVPAFTAALAQSSSFSGQGVANTAQNTAAPTLYLPAGGWMVCTPSSGLPVFQFGPNKKGFTIMGDGYDVTFLYNCDTASTMTSFGYWIGNANMTNLYLHDFTIDGGYIPVPTNGFCCAIYTAPTTFINNVHLQGISASGGAEFQGGIYATNFTVDKTAGTAIFCSTCSGEFHNSSASNSGTNLIIQNVVGLQTGPGFRWWGGLIDECGSCVPTQVINSQDVWFIGVAGFGTGTKHALSVDGTSFVHTSGGIWGSFGNDGNSGGVSIAAGGVLQASDTRFVSTGTQTCVANSGILQDNGGNTCESMFTISSGTSTGTTAVLTLANMGAAVNANCSVGDALDVEGAAILGYNGYYPAGATSGITATSATTLTYTTAGSNLGALGAGGVAFCRNLQQYSGTLPKALLNNPVPNTCYVTGTFAATVTGAPMCNFALGTATNITRITASSTTVTACTVAPVVTISDGTLSQTLTLTTAKSLWDSSVDASTGVGTTKFKPNGIIQVTNTAGTCTTPPTNFSVSYNISPILSN